MRESLDQWISPPQSGKPSEVCIGRTHFCIVLDGQRRKMNIAREVAADSELFKEAA